MTWLFGQLWFLLLLAFLVGALVSYVIAMLALPRVRDLEEETGTTSKGLLS